MAFEQYNYMVRVHPIDPCSREIRQFSSLPKRIYSGDPHYSPPPRHAVVENLIRHEFGGNQQAFLALEGAKPAARVVARLQTRLLDRHGRPYGLLGFFEALHSRRAAKALFQQAVEWLRSRGAGSIIGPMDGDTWHRYRLNVGPFEERPFLMEPYNPRYYPALWKSSGFEVLESYCSKRVEDLDSVIEVMRPKLENALAAGYHFERLALDRFDAELGRLYELSRRIFSGNLLYTEISREEFLELYQGSRALIDRDLVTFARAPDGTDAGFLFALPDRFRAVAAMKGGTGLLAKLRFVTARERVDTVNLKSLGVLGEHRMNGLGAALMCDAYQTARAKGYRRANLCLILDGNPSGRMEGGRSETLRRYELYRIAAEAPDAS